MWEVLIRGVKKTFIPVVLPKQKRGREVRQTSEWG